MVEAATVAGYRHPETMGPRVLKNPAVRAALEDILDKAGLSDRYLAEKVLALCEAKSVAKDGSERPDWTARARGLELLARLRGHYRQAIDVTSTSFEARVSLTADLQDNPDALRFLAEKIGLKT
jgi:hypothetical protein